MTAAMDLLKPYMAASGHEPVGSACLGTVQGDMHDIGKNLVASMFEGCGFKVINLGIDVSSEKFVKAEGEDVAARIEKHVTDFLNNRKK